MKKIRNKNEELSKLTDAIDSALDTWKEYVVQIFIGDKDKLNSIGTGFYLNLNERVFFISAAHVFDDYPENDRYIFNNEGEIQKLTGIFYKHLATGKRDDDIKDIMAIEIDNKLEKRVIKQSMLYLQTDYQEDFYAFLGYPGTKNGQKYKEKVMKNRPHSYWDKSIKANEVQSFQYDDKLNVLINYTAKKTIHKDSGPQKGVKMKGISGGPVLLITPPKNLSSFDDARVKLVGVVFHTLERKKYMSAVRLKVLSDYLLGNSNYQDEFETFEIK